MNKYDVIESKRWQHQSGRMVSAYGRAVPWLTNKEKEQWELVTVGWTVFNNRTGQVGIGRGPWKTKEEATAWVDNR